MTEPDVFAVLSGLQRELIVLKYAQGRRVAESAGLLGITEGKAASQLAFAMLAIEKAFGAPADAICRHLDTGESSNGD